MTSYHPLIAKLGTPPEPKVRPLAGSPTLLVRPAKSKKWSIYWLLWLFGMVITGFVLPELHALLNKQQGDTLSENIRLWLKTDTPGGGASWLAVVSLLFGLVVWLAGHIANVPGWPLTG